MHEPSSTLDPNANWLQQAWVRFDRVSEIFIAAFIALSLLAGATFLLSYVRLAPAWPAFASVAFFLWCATTEMWFLFSTWHVVSNGYEPYFVAVALRQPTLPVVLRPLIALWWGYQSLLALVWGMCAGIAAQQLPLIAGIALALITIALSRATFGFALLAMSAFTKEPVRIMRLWSWRDWWAVASGIIVALAKLCA